MTLPLSRYRMRPPAKRADRVRFAKIGGPNPPMLLRTDAARLIPLDGSGQLDRPSLSFADPAGAE